MKASICSGSQIISGAVDVIETFEAAEMVCG
jgi:hypothetical protein